MDDNKEERINTQRQKWLVFYMWMLAIGAFVLGWLVEISSSGDNKDIGLNRVGIVLEFIGGFAILPQLLSSTNRLKLKIRIRRIRRWAGRDNLNLRRILSVSVLFIMVPASYRMYTFFTEYPEQAWQQTRFIPEGLCGAIIIIPVVVLLETSFLLSSFINKSFALEIGEMVSHRIILEAISLILSLSVDMLFARIGFILFLIGMSLQILALF